MPAESDRLLQIAAAERAAARDFVGHLLPDDARVSVYLYQPILADGLRADSPGALFDIGPIPHGVPGVRPELLYQCAEAGRTGSFLQSAEDCTRRVPQTTEIDRAAYDSYRTLNGRVDVRRAQISVERARYGFDVLTDDGPPVGWHIHHLALAPSVHSFATVATGRLPVLGTLFTVTREKHPVERHEYSNLVDYAIFIAEEALEIRAKHLLGDGHVDAHFAGSALEKLLEDPTCDEALQLVVKLLFAHHWFFPYDTVAHALLARCANGGGADALYARHGWSPPSAITAETRTDEEIRQLVVADMVTLVRHCSWYRLGQEFRPRPGAVAEAVTRALNTVLVLLCGTPAVVPAPRAARRLPLRRERCLYLAPPPMIASLDRGEGLLAPVFGASGIQQLARGRTPRSVEAVAREEGEGSNGDSVLARFGKSFEVCAPGDTEGLTRTHLKPSSFVDGFDRGGVPRFSTATREGMRERTKWLCSYAIARLAEYARHERRSHDDSLPMEGGGRGLS